jgi:hypothetical protein
VYPNVREDFAPILEVSALFRGLLIIFVTLIAMIAAVVGVVGAGLHRITAERREADASWHKPEPVAVVAATNPTAGAIVASETEEPEIPVSNALALWAKEAKLQGGVQIVETQTANWKGRGGAPPKEGRKLELWKQRQAMMASSVRQHLANFNAPEDRAEWEVQVPKDGNYEVDLTYACPEWQAGAHFVIVVGDKELMFTTEGGRHETFFRVVPLGKLTLTSGKATLVLRPTLNSPSHHPAINVRSVQLIPVP